MSKGKRIKLLYTKCWAENKIKYSDTFMSKNEAAILDIRTLSKDASLLIDLRFF